MNVKLGKAGHFHTKHLCRIAHQAVKILTAATKLETSINFPKELLFPTRSARSENALQTTRHRVCLLLLLVCHLVLSLPQPLTNNCKQVKSSLLWVPHLQLAKQGVWGP